MIGLDTNVIVRFLTQDDPVQSPIATRIMGRLTREEPGYVSAIVLAEVSWVLSLSYRVPREQVADAIEGLLRSANIIVENAEAAYRALALYRAANRASFADALIERTAMLAGAHETVTFDRSATAELGMRLAR